MKANLRRAAGLRRAAEIVALGCLCGLEVAAQAPQPVSWALTAADERVKAGATLSVDLSAKFDAGWHVYGLNQGDGGPTPLRITVDPASAAQLAGTPSGTAPVKAHDATFDTDTETFVHPFTLHVPLKLKAGAGAGNQEIALNVRFQACNDHICLPPKTVRLTTDVKIVP